jgi:hypothetical protein
MTQRRPRSPLDNGGSRMGTFVRMTAPGSPRTRFQRANPLTMLYAESDDARFERAAVRLTGRFALERDTATLESLVTLASALVAANGERARAVLDS